MTFGEAPKMKQKLAMLKKDRKVELDRLKEDIDESRESEWKLQWFLHKWQRPTVSLNENAEKYMELNGNDIFEDANAATGVLR